MSLLRKKSMPQNNAMEIILRQMDLWYRTVLGSHLLQAEQAELDRCLPRYFGRHLLQLGGPSEVLMFGKSPTSYRTRLTPEYASVFHGPTIQADLQNLPLMPESVDVVLLPHVLEFHARPENLLQQLYAALVPEGHILILGFNPYSLWGLKSLCNSHKTLPWRGCFWSIAKVCRWLKRAGYVIEARNSLFFRPPLTNPHMLKKLLLLEVIGRLFYPGNGGAYLIVAKKVVPSLLPVDNALLKKRPAILVSEGR